MSEETAGDKKSPEAPPGLWDKRPVRIMTAPFRLVRAIVGAPLKLLSFLLPVRMIDYAGDRLFGQIPIVSKLFQKVGENLGYKDKQAIFFGAAALAAYGGIGYGVFLFATTGAAVATGSFIASSAVVGANALAASSVGVAVGGAATTSVAAVAAAAAFLGPVGVGIVVAVVAAVLLYEIYKSFKETFSDKKDTKQKSEAVTVSFNEEKNLEASNEIKSSSKFQLLLDVANIPVIGVLLAIAITPLYLLFKLVEAIINFFSSDKKDSISSGMPLSEEQKASLIEIKNKSLETNIKSLVDEVNNESDPKRKNELQQKLAQSLVFRTKIEASIESGKNEGLTNIYVVTTSAANNHRTSEKICVFNVDPQKHHEAVEFVAKQGEKNNTGNNIPSSTNKPVTVPKPSPRRGSVNDEQKEQQKQEEERLRTRSMTR